MIQITDPRLWSHLTVDEGDRQFPYDDATGKSPAVQGKLTIGVGRNLTDVGLSPDERKYLFHNDMLRVREDLNGNLPWWIALDDVRQIVLIDLCFNLGIHGLLGFPKFLGHLRAGEYDAAASELASSRWDQEVGDRATRLETMIRTGIDVYR